MMMMMMMMIFFRLVSPGYGRQAIRNRNRNRFRGLGHAVGHGDSVARRGPWGR